MRYYYDDPIKAAWMAREHKIVIFLDEFICVKEKNIPKTDGSNTYTTECEEWRQCHTTDDTVILESLQDRFNVHQDCHELFKPRVGDLMTNLGLRGWRLQGIRADGELVFHDDRGSEILGLAPEMEIIQRDNKAWFEPKREDV